MILTHEQTDQELRDDFDRQIDAGAGTVYHDTNFLVQKTDDDARRVSGLASVEQISHTGHKLIVAGCDLDRFKLNPIVLAAHRRLAELTLEPGAIGTVEKVTKSQGKLRFYGMEFDTDKLSDLWYQKIRKKTVRMVSVGFNPLAYDTMEESVGRGHTARTIRYIQINQWELTEISPVCIGANQGAFITPPRAPKQSDDVIQLQEQVANLQEAVDRLLARKETADRIAQESGQKIAAGVSGILSQLSTLTQKEKLNER